MPKHRIFTINGQTGNLTEWVNAYQVCAYQTVVARLRKGWELEEALSTPPHHNNYTNLRKFYSYSYRYWRNLLLNASTTGYVVCERWRDDEGFLHFVEDMGTRPQNAELVRYDIGQEYNSTNCFWETPRRDDQKPTERRTQRRKLERRLKEHDRRVNEEV